MSASASEAVVAVDRTVSARPERHGGVCATLGAYCRMHFASVPAKSTAEATPVALTASRLAAGRAAPGLIRVALLRMIRLVVGAKGERTATLYACQRSVLVVHHDDLLHVIATVEHLTAAARNGRNASWEIHREAGEEPEGELGYQAATEGTLSAATRTSVAQKRETLKVRRVVDRQSPRIRSRLVQSRSVSIKLHRIR